MRVALTQKLKLVWREIDNQQIPAWLQNAGSLANGPGRISQEVQHLMHYNGTS